MTNTMNKAYLLTVKRYKVSVWHGSLSAFLTLDSPYAITSFVINLLHIFIISLISTTCP